jgi:hypothetical protein
MTIRKRTWKSPKGETKDAWQVDYVDTQGIRRRQHFANKQDADSYHAIVAVNHVIQRFDDDPVIQSLARVLAQHIVQAMKKGSRG